MGKVKRAVRIFSAPNGKEKVVFVEPRGKSDARNIKAALEELRGQGIVELGKGDFYVNDWLTIEGDQTLHLVGRTVLNVAIKVTKRKGA